MPGHIANEQTARAALVVAHPGHELRVHGWLETARPLVCVLTDGSARSGRSRLASTAKVVRAAGATAGAIYGALTDQELYAAILNHNHSLFISFVEQLADILLRERIECIAGDALEGYNPAHDACRLVVNSAVKIVNRARRTRVANYDFTLVGRSGHCAERLRDDAIWVRLDEEAFARKLDAARNYAELSNEVEAALDGAGSFDLQRHPEWARHVDSHLGETDINSFRVECLRPVEVDESADYLAPGARPFYECYGERQVSAGHYTKVLRYREHVLPLAEALHTYAGSDG